MQSHSKERLEIETLLVAWRKLREGARVQDEALQLLGKVCMERADALGVEVLKMVSSARLRERRHAGHCQICPGSVAAPGCKRQCSEGA